MLCRQSWIPEVAGMTERLFDPLNLIIFMKYVAWSREVKI